MFSKRFRGRGDEVNYRQEEKKILDSVLGPKVYDKRIRPSGLNSTGTYNVGACMCGHSPNEMNPISKEMEWDHGGQSWPNLLRGHSILPQLLLLLLHKEKKMMMTCSFRGPLARSTVGPSSLYLYSMYAALLSISILTSDSIKSSSISGPAETSPGSA